MERVVIERFRGNDSAAIVKDNTPLLYWFADRLLDEFDDWGRITNGERHVLHSTSESLMTALAGIAVEQGYIDSTQVSCNDLLDYATYANGDPRKAEMALEDVLAMRLGLQRDDGHCRIRIRRTISLR